MSSKNIRRHGASMRARVAEALADVGHTVAFSDVALQRIQQLCFYIVSHNLTKSRLLASLHIYREGPGWVLLNYMHSLLKPMSSTCSSICVCLSNTSSERIDLWSLLGLQDCTRLRTCLFLQLRPRRHCCCCSKVLTSCSCQVASNGSRALMYGSNN